MVSKLLMHRILVARKSPFISIVAQKYLSVFLSLSLSLRVIKIIKTQLHQPANQRDSKFARQGNFTHKNTPRKNTKTKMYCVCLCVHTTPNRCESSCENYFRPLYFKLFVFKLELRKKNQILCCASSQTVRIGRFCFCAKITKFSFDCQCKTFHFNFSKLEQILLFHSIHKHTAEIDL